MDILTKTRFISTPKSSICIHLKIKQSKEIYRLDMRKDTFYHLIGPYNGKNIFLKSL